MPPFDFFFLRLIFHLVFQGISVSSVYDFGWPGFGMDMAASSLVASGFFSFSSLFFRSSFPSLLLLIDAPA